MNNQVAAQDRDASAAAPARPSAGSAPAAPLLTTVVSLACLVALVVRVAVHAVRPLSDAATWLDLRLGHGLWGPWSLAHPGPPNRFATAPWVPSQWSTEMLLARLEDWFGLPGVAWLFALLCVALVVAVYAVCRRRADMLVSALVTGIVLIGAGAMLATPAQVLGLVLFAVTAERWSLAAREGRPPWVLVPLTWVWATANELWWAGVVLGLVMAVAILLDSRGTGRRPLRMLAVPVLSLAAAGLTPVGPGLLLSQLAGPMRSQLADEWAATSFRTAPAFAVAAMAGILLLTWTRRGHVRWTSLLTFLLACTGAVLVTGLVPFAAVLLAPLVAEAMTGLRPVRATTRRALRAERLTVLVATVSVLAGALLAAPHTAARAGQVPDRFADRLAALPAGSSVLVEDPVGAWIEWRFPTLSPGYDGLAPAYPARYLERFAAFHAVGPGWRTFVADSHARVAVLVEGSALTEAMRARLGWRQVQQDGQWVYLVAPGTDAR